MGAQDESDKVNEPDSQPVERNSFRSEPQQAAEGDVVERNEFRSTAGSSIQRFEAELAAMTPRAAQLDRDRLMFLAGQASVPLSLADRAGRRWVWPSALSAMTALAASLLVMLAVRPEPRVIERVVQVPIKAQQELSGPNTTTPSQSDPSARQSIGEGLIAQVSHRPPPDKSLAGASYLNLRDQVLAMGIESWQGDGAAGRASNGESPVGYHELLDSLLHGG